MSSIIITPRDWKILAWIALLFGALLTAGGLVGVWLQGLFYEGGFPAPATVDEMRMAFTLPTAVTTLGSLIVASVLLTSSLTAAWTPTRRLGALIGFASWFWWLAPFAAIWQVLVSPRF